MQERKRLGLYAKVPCDENGFLTWPTDVPAWNRPIRDFQAERGGTVDFRDQLQFVEVYPNEVPGLQALRDEELWLSARIEKLEVEWTSWLEGWLDD